MSSLQAATHPTDFRRLVDLVNGNERLLAELDLIRVKIRGAWAYLASRDSNTTLALACLDRLRLRHSAILALLRSNRVAARELLGRPLPDDEPETWPAPSSH